MQDLERGVKDEINAEPWQTDTSIGDWFYRTGQKYKTSADIVQMLVDIVSKNGNLLINMVQTPEGELEPDVLKTVEEIGDWTAVNGEGIYGTRPWKVYGEKPADAPEIKSGGFNEGKLKYSAKDIRFTTKGETLYAFCLGTPTEDVRIKSLGKNAKLAAHPVATVELLGSGEKPSLDAGRRRAGHQTIGRHAGKPGAVLQNHLRSMRGNFKLSHQISTDKMARSAGACLAAISTFACVFPASAADTPPVRMLPGELSADQVLNGEYPYPPSPAVEVKEDWTGFAKERLGQVPPPGVHPRILISPDQLPDLRQRLKETEVGKTLYATMEGRIHGALHDPQNWGSQFYEKLAAGDVAGATRAHQGARRPAQRHRALQALALRGRPRSARRDDHRRRGAGQTGGDGAGDLCRDHPALGGQGAGATAGRRRVAREDQRPADGHRRFRPGRSAMAWAGN